MTGFNLKERQQYALERALSGSNILITGSGGVGKSTTVNKIMDPNTVLCAPTGIAALNVRGVTCHSLFGLPIGVPLTEDFMKIPFKMRELFNNWSPVKRIVLSECSMLRRDMFELINSRLQMLRGSREPFGGIQVVMEGDYFQLDPIVSPRDEKLFYREYESPFNFTSDIFDFEIVELTEVLRQSNKRQIDMLNSIRRKDKYYKFALDAIIKESRPYIPSKDVTHLCCYKKDANKYNKKYFNELTTPVSSFEARISGNDKWTDSIVPHTLNLREGARVILKCNDVDGQFVNGEKGIVTYVDEVLIKVLKDNGVEVVVYPNEWEKYEYHTGSKGVEKEVTSTFTQYPLDLAYGQSIHSSQSMTLDNLALDVGRGCFAHGQLYVALSRITDIKNLSFVNKPVYSDVICHKDVKQFYRSIST